MKLLLTSLALLALSCGRSSSQNKKTADSNDIQSLVLPGDRPAPGVGVYLGSCERQGAIGVASGVEITATQIFPVTVVFGDQTCAPSTMSTWGYTGNFDTFETYANYVGTRAAEVDGQVSPRISGETIVFESSRGDETVLQKMHVALYTAQRLQISLLDQPVSKESKTYTSRVQIQNSIFADDQWELAFYCVHQGRLLRQESSFTRKKGAATLSAKINSWNQDQIAFPARCQASLVLRHGNDGSAVSDLAYSQFVTIP